MRGTSYLKFFECSREQERICEMKQYGMRLPAVVYGGTDALEKMREVAAPHRKATLFTDRGVRGAGLADRVVELLQDTGLAVEVLGDLPAEPLVDDAIRTAEAFRATGSDLIVGLGGGSVMDAAKLAGVLNTSEYTLRDLLKTPGIARKQTRTLMIPTTAGTGSEATPNSIVTVPEEELKVGIVSGALMADGVLLDASLIRNLPAPIAAATGMDALCHAIECYTGNKANPFSDLYAMQALRLIFANIEAACEPGGDLAAKEAMLTASFYAGIAISAAGTTAVHALAYPLGGKYRIAHGVSNAMLLLPVMRFNEDAIRERLAEIHDAIGLPPASSSAEKSAQVLARIEELVAKLSIPVSLAPYGITAGDLDTLVASGMKVTRLLDNNAKPLTAEDARSIYSRLL